MVRTVLFRPWLIAQLTGAVVFNLQASELQPQSGRSWATAPPPAPPILRQPAPAGRSLNLMAAPAAGSTLYSIGNPTADEQLYLEYINRARANPAAEAQLFKNTTDPDVLAAYDPTDGGFYDFVDLDLMVSQFNLIAPAPPLSMNSQLTAAARGHSVDMFNNQFQEHTGSAGSTTVSRAVAQGYPWAALGENIYINAESVWHGHAAFEVDWGPGIGGMQTPPGHRVNIHSTDFREIGIGVINGVNGEAGPQVVTQDFGTAQNAKPLITGVAYYDLNGNQFYDLGEGLGGVRVTVSNSTFHAITADSGGYSVPVPGDGTYTVTFSVDGSAQLQRTVTVSNLQNVKVDFTPSYSAPAVSGGSVAFINQDNAYQISAVRGAIGYDWRVAQAVAHTTTEGAEGGGTTVTITTTADYNPIATDVKASGSSSFHLTHKDPAEQVILFNPVFRPSSSSLILFKSRLGWAMNDQFASLQVSTDAGVTWDTLWTQSGASEPPSNLGPGETSFNTRTASLSAYAGKEVRVRFIYGVRTSGEFHYFGQTDAGVGLYLDDIQFTATDIVINERIEDAGNDLAFTFSPTQSGNYLLAARARLPGQSLPWGPAFAASAQVGTLPVQLRLTRMSQPVAGLWLIEFTVANPRTGASYRLEMAPEADAAFIEVTTATLEPISSSTFRFRTATPNQPRGFYRARAN